jgi:polyferredoxin
MLKITRDEKRCVGCGECVVVCPQSQPGTTTPVLVSPAPGEIPVVSCIENCIQCMSCLDVCRASAILFEGAALAPRLIVDEEVWAAVAKIL